MTGFFGWLFSANTIVGLLGIGAGILVILQAYNLQHKVMPFGIAEKYLGPGQGTTGYKLVGLAIIALSFFAFVGVIDLFPSSTPTSPMTQTSDQTPQTQQNLPSPGRGVNITP